MFKHRTRNSEQFPRRSMLLEMTREQPTDPNRIRVIASTSNPVRWSGWTETLLHGAENVDVRAAVTVLFNHDRNQPIGRIVSTQLDGQAMTAELEIDPDARADSGISILKNIRSGAIRGVSIGYAYDEARDATVSDGDEMLVTVNRWQLREISITPTQADVAAQVLRSLPEVLKVRTAHAAAGNGRRNAMNTQEIARFRAAGLAAGMSEQWVASVVERGCSLDQANAELVAELGKRTAPVQQNNAQDVAGLRAELEGLKLRTEVNDLARANGVELSAADLSGVNNRDAGRALVMERKAKALETKLAGSSVVEVTRDAADKVLEAAVDGMLALGDVAPKSENKGMRGRSGCAILREVARRSGSTGELNSHELYSLARNPAFSSRGANQTSAMFANLLGNVADKALLQGFQRAPGRWRPIASIRRVNDYKAFKDLAATVGTYAETEEGLPLPEMAMAEVSGGSQVKMQGGTIKLSEQAIVNDDLGEFVRIAANQGVVADRTIEKGVTVALAGYDYTTNSTKKSTAGAITDANVSVVRALMLGLADGSGNKIGNEPIFLIVPPTIFNAAWTVCYPAAAATSAQQFAGRVTPVELPWLESSAVTGYSTEDWYMAADPTLGLGLRVAFINGQENPIVEEFDPGAVCARMWRMKLPHVCYMASKYGVVYADKQ